MSNKAPITAKIAEAKAILKEREAKAAKREIVTKEEVADEPAKSKKAEK